MLTRRAFTAGALSAVSLCAHADTGEPALRVIEVAPGVRLHYAEAGRGEPVVFVHGSLADGSYWSPQLPVFARDYRAVAYSRRYNPPNSNAPIPGYSAVIDARDLTGLIGMLGLGRVHIVGHSYGGLTALFLAVRQPELVRTLTLCEPPVVSLLAHGDTEERLMAAEVEARMRAPMAAALAHGDTEGAVRTFINYVRDDPRAWDRFSADDKAQTLRGAREWEVIFAGGTLFPELAPEAVRGVRAPCLMLSGGRSYRFSRMIDARLATLLPDVRRIVLPAATHNMWFDAPETCGSATLAFLGAHRTA